MEGSRPMKRPEQESVQNGDHSAAASVSASERVGIDDLSDEILRQIIRRVGDLGWRSRRDLFNLGVCSRRFHLLTEPELYSDFRQEEGTRERPNKFCPHLLLFLRTILARPDLARCIRRLGIAPRTEFERDLLPVESELGNQDWTRIRRVVDETSASEDEAATWMEGVQRGQGDAVSAVLLSVAPNLEELEVFNWAHTCDTELLFSVFDRARNLQESGKESPLSMSKLRRVSANIVSRGACVGFSVVLPFLQLNSVQAFRGLHVGCERYYDNFGIPRLRDLPLKLATKELEFSDSSIDFDDMVVILRLFPQLERFSYEYQLKKSSFFDMGVYGLGSERMMEALTHLKSCLKDLTLIICRDSRFRHFYGDGCDEDEDDWDGGNSPIGSLAGFQKLVSIRAKASIMIGADWSDGEQHPDHGGFATTQSLVDAVPPTLESLALEQCNRHVVRHIFELVSQKPWRTPALRKLNLGWERVAWPVNESPREPTKHPGFTKEEAMELMAECDAADIELVIQDIALEVRS